MPPKELHFADQGPIKLNFIECTVNFRSNTSTFTLPHGKHAYILLLQQCCDSFGIHPANLPRLKLIRPDFAGTNSILKPGDNPKGETHLLLLEIKRTVLLCSRNANEGGNGKNYLAGWEKVFVEQVIGTGVEFEFMEEFMDHGVKKGQKSSLTALGDVLREREGSIVVGSEVWKVSTGDEAGKSGGKKSGSSSGSGGSSGGAPLNPTICIIGKTLDVGEGCAQIFREQRNYDFHLLDKRDKFKKLNPIFRQLYEYVVKRGGTLIVLLDEIHEAIIPMLMYIFDYLPGKKIEVRDPTDTAGVSDSIFLGRDSSQFVRNVDLGRGFVGMDGPSDEEGDGESREAVEVDWLDGEDGVLHYPGHEERTQSSKKVSGSAVGAENDGVSSDASLSLSMGVVVGGIGGGGLVSPMNSDDREELDGLSETTMSMSLSTVKEGELLNVAELLKKNKPFLGDPASLSILPNINARIGMGAGGGKGGKPSISVPPSPKEGSDASEVSGTPKSKTVSASLPSSPTSASQSRSMMMKGKGKGKKGSLSAATSTTSTPNKSSRKKLNVKLKPSSNVRSCSLEATSASHIGGSQLPYQAAELRKCQPFTSDPRPPGTSAIAAYGLNITPTAPTIVRVGIRPKKIKIGGMAFKVEDGFIGRYLRVISDDSVEGAQALYIATARCVIGRQAINDKSDRGEKFEGETDNESVVDGKDDSKKSKKEKDHKPGTRLRTMQIGIDRDFLLEQQINYREGKPLKGEEESSASPSQYFPKERVMDVSKILWGDMEPDGVRGEDDDEVGLKENKVQLPKVDGNKSDVKNGKPPGSPVGDAPLQPSPSEQSKNESKNKRTPSVPFEDGAVLVDMIERGQGKVIFATARELAMQAVGDLLLADGVGVRAKGN